MMGPSSPATDRFSALSGRSTSSTDPVDSSSAKTCENDTVDVLDVTLTTCPGQVYASPNYLIWHMPENTIIWINGVKIPMVLPGNRLTVQPAGSHSFVVLEHNDSKRDATQQQIGTSKDAATAHFEALYKKMNLQKDDYAISTSILGSETEGKLDYDTAHIGFYIERSHRIFDYNVRLVSLPTPPSKTFVDGKLPKLICAYIEQPHPGRFLTVAHYESYVHVEMGGSTEKPFMLNERFEKVRFAYNAVDQKAYLHCTACSETVAKQSEMRIPIASFIIDVSSPNVSEWNMHMNSNMVLAQDALPYIYTTVFPNGVVITYNQRTGRCLACTFEDESRASDFDIPPNYDMCEVPGNAFVYFRPRSLALDAECKCIIISLFTRHLEEDGDPFQCIKMYEDVLVSRNYVEGKGLPLASTCVSPIYTRSECSIAFMLAMNERYEAARIVASQKWNRIGCVPLGNLPLLMLFSSVNNYPALLLLVQMFVLTLQMKKISESHARGNRVLIEEREEAQSTIAFLKEMLSESEEKLKQLQRTNTQLKRDRDAVAERNVERENIALQRQLGEAHLEIESLVACLKESDEKVHSITQRFAKVNDAFDIYKYETVQLLGNAERVMQQSEKYKMQAEEAVKQLDELKLHHKRGSEALRCNAEQDQQQATIGKLRERNSELEEQLAELKLLHKKTTETLSHNADQNKQQQATLSRLRERNSELEKQLQARVEAANGALLEKVSTMARDNSKLKGEIKRLRASEQKTKRKAAGVQDDNVDVPPVSTRSMASESFDKSVPGAIMNAVHAAPFQPNDQLQGESYIYIPQASLHPGTWQTVTFRTGREAGARVWQGPLQNDVRSLTIRAFDFASALNADTTKLLSHALRYGTISVNQHQVQDMSLKTTEIAALLTKLVSLL